jgi:hypothetical protein
MDSRYNKKKLIFGYNLDEVLKKIVEGGAYVINKKGVENYNALNELINFQKYELTKFVTERSSAFV